MASSRTNPAYGEANGLFLEQPFLYIYIHSLFLNCTESEKNVFSGYMCIICDKKTRFWSDGVRACSFCSSI